MVLLFSPRNQLQCGPSKTNQGLHQSEQAYNDSHTESNFFLSSGIDTTTQCKKGKMYVSKMSPIGHKWSLKLNLS